MSNKLYIYDTTTWQERLQSAGRFDGNKNVTIAGVKSKKELLSLLGGFVKKGIKFDKCLIQTHGEAGVIKLGSDVITESILRSQFTGKFHQIFKSNTHLYFDGCNIAKGNKGWRFLEAAGKCFLKTGGGEVTGYTSLGFGLPGTIPFKGGHTVHFGGMRKVIVSFDGSKIKREDS